MKENVIILPRGGMKELKEKLKIMKVAASEPTILRALRGLSSKKENEGLYKLVRKVALEAGGAEVSK